MHKDKDHNVMKPHFRLFPCMNWWIIIEHYYQKYIFHWMSLIVIPLVLLCQFVFIFQQSSLSLSYFDKHAEKKEQFVFNFTQTGPHKSFIYVRMAVVESFANNWLPLPYLCKITRMLSIFMFLLGHSTICQLPLNDNGYHLYVSAFHFSIDRPEYMQTCTCSLELYFW